MRIYLLILGVITSLIVIGCSSFESNLQTEKKEVVTKQITKTETVKVQQDKCLKVKRDLSVSWEERKYWCNPGKKAAAKTGKVKTTAPKRSLKKNLSATDSINGEQKDIGNVELLIGVVKNLSKEDLRYVLGKIADAYEEYEKHEKHEKKQNKIAAADKTNAKITQISPEEHLIWFAANIEVLGLQGKAKLEKIISTDIDSSKKILLRGYASSEKDTEREDLDRLAVGRALSVRKMLEKYGIDESKVKILYRDKSKSGRYVEVILNG